MLKHLFSNQVALGFAQAGVAAAAAVALALAAQKRGIHLIGDTSVALIRGVAQIVVVGLVLVALLRGPWWTGPFLLAGMIFAAAATSARRVKRIPGALRVSFYSIALGSGSVIALMTVLGVIDFSVRSLIPVGSMLIANAMNGNALALERFRAEVAAHVGEIESALALGAAPAVTVSPYVSSALRASLIPPIDNLRSLGIVWIPGLMAGMLLSGEKPVYSSIYQFVVLALILAASGTTCLISTYLMSARAFTPAEQLRIGRPSQAA